MDNLPTINPDNELPPASGMSDMPPSMSSVPPKNNSKLIAGLIILFLIIALPAALFLSQRTQDIRQRAQSYCIPLDSFCGPGTSGNCCDGFCDNNTCKFCTANLQCTSGSEACCPGSNRVADSTCSGGFRCLPSSQGCTSAPDGSNCTGKLPGQSCTRSGIGGTCGIVSGSESTCTCVVPTENTCESNGGTCYFGYTDCANLDKVNAPPSMTCPQNPGSPLFNLCCISGEASPPPNCTCGPWTPGVCGPAGGCAEGSRSQTRSCTPDQCALETQCVPDSTCTTTPPGCTNPNGGTHRECVGNQCATVNNAPGLTCDDETNNTCDNNQQCVVASPPGASTSPVAAAQCTAVKIYSLVANGTTCPAVDAADADCWVQLNATQLAALAPNAQIYITTTGNAVNGATISEARIQVSTTGALAPWVQATHETLVKKPKLSVAEVDEYYVTYTIPATATFGTTFLIGAEVYSARFDTTPATVWDAATTGTGWR